ncbi:MAG: hypothetical protein NXI22_22550 [bacterium]|nr:hypothetical protein [bacterium]
MTKFYVESGSRFQMIVSADTVFQAVVRALKAFAKDNPLELADVVIVNERGFVWQREDHQLYGDEAVFQTHWLLGEPAEKKAPEYRTSEDM